MATTFELVTSDAKSFSSKLEKLKTKISEILTANISDILYRNRDEFIKQLKLIFKNTDITYNADLQKVLFKKIPNLTCSHCKYVIGVPIIYKKESRPAFRLFVGAVTKKISKI